MTQLTDLEQKVIKIIQDNLEEDTEGCGYCYWCYNPFYNGTTKTEYKGALASLVKKKIVVLSDNDGRKNDIIKIINKDFYKLS